MQGRDRDGCRCGHARNAHEHYRAGTDCALCRPGVCNRFKRASRFGLRGPRRTVDLGAFDDAGLRAPERPATEPIGTIAD